MLTRPLTIHKLEIGQTNRRRVPQELTAMSKQLEFARYRYTIRGMMIVVAVVAVALTWVMWTQRPRPFTVSGTVTYKGTPVSKGKIAFLPRNPAGQQATGQIIGGQYSLTSYALDKGAISGSYDVVVVSPSLPAKYQSQSTSGLKIMVQQGANMCDLNLQ
jgi:hypothetical protein